MAVVGRRTAVVAASSGLVVAIGAAPSFASADSAAGLGGVDTTTLAASARAALDTEAVVTAPVDAAWTLDVPEVTAVKPTPPPPAPTRAKATAAASRATTVARTVASSPVPQSVAGNAVLEIASRYVGVPYVSGGSTPAGFDCSGFVSYVYAQLGISLPRSSSAYAGVGTRVSRADALPGDIIFSPGHVGIYAGGDMQIDAPRPGKTIQFRGIWQSSPIFIRVS